MQYSKVPSGLITDM